MITFLLLNFLLYTSSLPQRNGRILLEDGFPKDASRQGEAGFRLLKPKDQSEDAVVIEAAEGEARQVGDIPRDRSGEDRAGFRLPLPQDTMEDLAVVVEATLDAELQGREENDIPQDNSGSSRAGFKLPLPDFIVVDADFDSDGRFVSDIPRDESGSGRAGFRLPLPDNDDLAVVVEAGDDGREQGRSTGDIPRDFSGATQAGFRLPHFPQIKNDDDFVVVEANINGDINGKSLADIPRDHSGEGRAGFRLPLPEDDVIVVEAGADNTEGLSRTLLPREKRVCGEPVEKGKCRARFVFFYFNIVSQQCERFIFGGCGETEQANLFSTMEECVALCQP